MKTIIVMPAFNEASMIAEVIKDVQQAGYKNILVIDDGSSDNTGSVARKAGAMVCSHAINRGLGGALGTGIQGALQLGADIVVTLDSDGQHAASDIDKVIAPLKKKSCDCVIGYRLYKNSDMPPIRKVFNWIGNVVTYLLFSVKVKDSQSGFRAFSKEAAAKMDIKTDRMEVSSEIIRLIGAHKLHLKEVPIKAIYTEYSMSKGQSFLVGVKTFIKLVFHKIRT